jgi:septal ring factor EnvC (AmiA/AmiB activator)
MPNTYMRYIKSTCLAITVGILISFTLPASKVHAQDIASVQKDISKQTSEIKAIRKKLLSLNKTAQKQSQALSKTSKAIGNSRKALTQTQKKLDSLERKLTDIRSQQQTLKANIRVQRHEIQQLLIAVYKNQDNNQLKMLLSQDSPEHLSRMLTYHEHFQSHQLEKIRSFQNLISEQKTLEIQLTENLVAVQETKTQQQAQQNKLLVQKQDQQKQIKQLKHSISSETSQLKKKQADQKRLNALLTEMRKALEDINKLGEATPFKKSKGKMPWPVKGRIVRSFGSAIAGGKMTSDGVLIKANAGKAVKAIHSGRVVFADWFAGFGLLTIVDHGDGYMSLYGQAESVVAEPGEWINRGDTIAFTGNTSDTGINGIYFELRHQGKPLNPKRWCTAR